MKLIVFGATGDVGRKVVAEALGRGHSVTAVARASASLGDSSGNVAWVDADLLAMPERAGELIAGHDAAVSALRPPQGQEPHLVDLTRAVVDAAAANGVPVFVTGGAATLKLPAGDGHTVLSAPGFLPDAVRPIAEACAAQQALLDSIAGVRWRHLLPPPMLIDGPRTGTYARGTDTLVADERGVSRISYADFAVAMIDLVENPEAAPPRTTVGWLEAAAQSVSG